MDQNDINIAMVTGNVSPLACFLPDIISDKICSKTNKPNQGQVT
jgi:hypothetical protein